MRNQFYHLKQILTLFIMQIFINQPDQLLKQVWNDKNVHIVQKPNSLGKEKFTLIDISMNAESQDEDKMYLESTFYRTNIRRGNSLIDFVDSKGKKKIMWARKGTQKIFDIRLEYIQSITRGIQLKNDEKKEFDVIFRNVNRCFDNGKRVELLKTEKANGQNAQVSYFYELGGWMICSKNVSMLVTCIKDLQNYDAKRYTYAKAIARQWFKEIEHLDKQKIKRLKKLLDGFTLVGQYCGNPQYQHLILYSQIRIIWFAFIDNFTEDYCIDPFQVRKDIEEFGFKFVRLKRMGSWNEKKKFYQELENLCLRIAQSSMEDAEYGMEGAIVYFLSPELKNNKPHTKVLGAGKLKTIEYRFFRKIREKLSRYFNRKESQPQLIKKYEQQCEQLQKANYSPAPFPLLYYTQILKKGCQLIRQTKITQEYLRSKFVTVLNMLFYVIHKNISLKILGHKLIKSHNFLDEVTKIPISAYGTMGCSTKIVYVPIDLPKVLDNRLSQQLAGHFDKLGLKFQTIECGQSTNEVEKAFTTINNSSVGDEKTTFLMHFYLSDLKMDQVQKLLQKLKYKGKKNVYHQFLIITDSHLKDSLFEDADHNQYPYRLETIILSYWKVYEKVKNTPTIQEKIDLLKSVTDKLKAKRDILQTIEKDGLKSFSYRISGNTNFEESEKIELGKIVSSILVSEKQYENYCRLILKLDKYSEASFALLSQDETHEEVKSLIKGCFMTVPEIDFTQQ